VLKPRQWQCIALQLERVETEFSFTKFILVILQLKLNSASGPQACLALNLELTMTWALAVIIQWLLHTKLTIHQYDAAGPAWEAWNKYFSLRNIYVAQSAVKCSKGSVWCSCLENFRCKSAVECSQV
jgi:hypothetical protein